MMKIKIIPIAIPIPTPNKIPSSKLFEDTSCVSTRSDSNSNEGFDSNSGSNFGSDLFSVINNELGLVSLELIIDSVIVRSVWGRISCEESLVNFPVIEIGSVVLLPPNKVECVKSE